MKIKKRLRSLGMCLSAFMLLMSAASAQQPVRGKLKSVSGEPLAGATVQVKGTNISSVTTPDGGFSIAASSNSTLVFSYI
ncbi:MAG: carboxypeptidase-like regulatory domain-containing protein, partial [Chitinophagaceae bacterium]|nr:carboxypeptidase-like regulatory domain-containing protein [Chitinophagaceae bacterium]